MTSNHERELADMTAGEDLETAVTSAWEHIYYALRESMRDLDAAVLQRLADDASAGVVAEVAQDTLTHRNS